MTAADQGFLPAGGVPLGLGWGSLFAAQCVVKLPEKAWVTTTWGYPSNLRTRFYPTFTSSTAFGASTRRLHLMSPHSLKLVVGDPPRQKEAAGEAPTAGTEKDEDEIGIALVDIEDCHREEEKRQNIALILTPKDTRLGSGRGGRGIYIHRQNTGTVAVAPENKKAARASNSRAGAI